ncbi:hypothetical protein F4861DRAFT_544673, partial [Xylaria intraflava]
MIDLFSRTYATSGKIHREGAWEKFSNHKYDGKDPVEFSTKWLRLLRECNDSGMKVSPENQPILFMTSVKEKAYKTPPEKNSGSRPRNQGSSYAANGEEKKNKGKGNGKGRKPTGKIPHNNKEKSWDKEKGPKCFNCGKWGHLARDCTEKTDSRKDHSANTAAAANSPEYNQGPPPGLEGLANLSVSYAATTNPRQLAALEDLYNRTFPEVDDGSGSESGKISPLEVVNVVEATPSVNWIADTGCYSTTPPQSRLLFDSGSTVDITNEETDFLKGSVMIIPANQPLKIMTGGGPVVATKVGK